VIVTLYVYNQYSEITNTVIHVQIECILFNDEHLWPPGRFTDNWISNENTDVNKQLDISIDLCPRIKDAHTITKMNNNIYKTYIAKTRSVNALHLLVLLKRP
jgi:hypothetical protein